MNRNPNDEYNHNININDLYKRLEVHLEKMNEYRNKTNTASEKSFEMFMNSSTTKSEPININQHVSEFKIKSKSPADIAQKIMDDYAKKNKIW